MIVNLDPKIQKDLVELAKKVKEAKYWYILKCYSCKGKGCYYCDFKGFLLKLFKPSFWDEELWKNNLLGKIKKESAPEWIFHTKDLNKVLEIAEEANV